MEVIKTLAATSRFASTLYGWQQQRHESSNNGNHDKKFDNCEPAPLRVVWNSGHFSTCLEVNLHDVSRSFFSLCVPNADLTVALVSGASCQTATVGTDRRAFNVARVTSDERRPLGAIRCKKFHPI